MFHDDWELNGDGSGDIRSLMFDPARRIMDLCDEIGAKYTFFAELGQQFTMKASPDPTHQKTALEWESIMKDAISRGHDVQLHFHPQWSGAYNKDGRWVLNHAKWSTAKLEKNELFDWLHKGVRYLTDLFKGLGVDHKVVAFRGGGYLVQPSGNIISVLKEVGVLADVTVIKGMKASHETMGEIDFTYAPSSIDPWFPDPNDLAKSSSRNQGFFCLPIYSFQTHLPLPVYSFLKSPASAVYALGKYQSDRRRPYTPVYYRPAGQYGGGQQKSSPLKERTLILDHGQLHHSVIIQHVERIHKSAEMRGRDAVPLILATHSKTFYSYKNFETLLKKLVDLRYVSFETTRQVVNDIIRWDLI